MVGPWKACRHRDSVERQQGREAGLCNAFELNGRNSGQTEHASYFFLCSADPSRIRRRNTGEASLCTVALP